VRSSVLSALVSALLGLAASGRAAAGTHVVQRGETLEHVAQVYGCSVDALLRANRLRTTLVRAGTVVDIPACSIRSRARTRERTRPSARDRARRAARVPEDDLDRARLALATIDGATVIADDRDADDRDVRDVRDVSRGTLKPWRPSGLSGAWRSPESSSRGSVGQPWSGELRDGERLPAGEGYRIRRPNRAFGATHVIGHVQRAIAVVRALYPEVHTLAIGDLSAQHGGKLANHQSHQSGLDIDLGFYFHRVPEGYPDTFAPATGDLDLAATWALLTAFARTTHLDDGVQLIFLDHAVQARLYRWAKQRGTPDDQLAAILQFPREPDALAGLVRHWPHHHDHLHVRFKPAR